MFKTRNELLEIIRALWRNTLEEHKSELVREGNDISNSLYELYELVESKITMGDEWKHLANWVFSQSLDLMLEHKHSDLKFSDLIQRVKIKTFDYYMRRNMRKDCWNDCWAEERAIWEKLPKLPWDR